MSLKVKLVLFLAVVLVVSFSMAIFFAIFQTKKVIREFEIKDSRISVNHIYGIAELYFNRVGKDIQSISDDSSIKSYLSGDEEKALEISDNLETIKEKINIFKNILILDIDCTVKLGDSEAVSIIGKSLKEREYCQVAKKTESSYISQSFLNSVNQQLTLVSIVPVRNSEQKVIGYVVGGVNLEELRLQLEKAAGKDSYVTLYDSGYNFFLDTRFSIEEFSQNKNLQNNLIGSRLRSEKKEDYFQEGNHMIGYGKMDFLTVAVHWPKDINKSFIDAIYKSIAYPTIACLLVILFTVWIYLYFVLKNLEKITLAAQELSKGKFVLSIGSKISSRTDEIGILAKTFKKMAIELRLLYVDLDRKVKEKTSEIMEKNKYLEDAKRAILNVLEDVENEKNSIAKEKARDEALLESIGDGVLVVDNKGRITFINKTAQKMLGYEASEIVGENFEEIIGAQDDLGEKISSEKRPIAMAIQENEIITTSFINNPIYYVRKDETKFPVSITVNPVKLEKKVIGAINIFRDMTYEKDIDRAKSEFVSLASHQLRTPLSSISWYAEMMIDGDVGKLNSEQQKYLENIYQSNRRMIDLVNALLNVSRIELGTFMIEPEKIDLIDLVNGLLKELVSQIIEKDMAIEREFPKKFEYYADPNLIRIIFQNLITNAIKYTPSKGTIGIRIEKEQENLIISIKDNGYGIPAEQQKNVFSKFFRAENIRKFDTEGNGLGLYMIKSIIDEIEGSIYFISNENEGTEFVINLPISGMKKKEGTKKLS